MNILPILLLIQSLTSSSSFLTSPLRSTPYSFIPAQQHQQQHQYVARPSLVSKSKATDTNDSENDDSTSSLAPIPEEWKDEVLTSLSAIIHPYLERDIVSLGLISNEDSNSIQIDTKTRQLTLDIEITTLASPCKDEIQTLCKEQVNALPWTNGEAIVTMTSKDLPQLDENAGMGGNGNSDVPFGLARVKNIIAVSSCKGGVGKSTTSVNLAYALSEAGASVGIFDADVYGPSLPTMVTPDHDAVNFIGRQIEPLGRNGVKLMSFGYVNEGSAVMRGPMITQLLDQFLSLTYWGPLDYLILDMPPGTGDIQLTLSQRLNITAAVIVTTPQELSFVDVERGIEMFDTVNVPCVSVVENMAYIEIGDNDKDSSDDDTSGAEKEEFEEEMKNAIRTTLQENGIVANNNGDDSVSNDEKITNDLLQIVQETIKNQKTKSNENKMKQLKIFGQGHKERLSEQWGIEHTYSIPLMDKIASHGDNGTPYILEYPDSKQSSIYNELASSVIQEVEKLHYSETNSRPTVNYNEESNILDFNFGDSADVIPSAELRRDCKCAACVEEFTGRQILKPEDIPDSVRPTNMNPTGNYALSVDWSDGHRSLYPYRQIRALVEDRKLLSKEKEEVVS
jgi:Mrp family chromosome partitioning ATPase/DUF971 family protein